MDTYHTSTYTSTSTYQPPNQFDIDMKRTRYPAVSFLLKNILATTLSRSSKNSASYPPSSSPFFPCGTAATAAADDEEEEEDAWEIERVLDGVGIR